MVESIIPAHYNKFTRLACITTIAILLCIIPSCPHKESKRILITESRLPRYLFQALNVDFKFEYEILKYEVLSAETREIVEQWKIKVSGGTVKRIAKNIESSSSRKCNVFKTTPGQGGVPIGTKRIPGYKCTLNLYDEHLGLYAFFKSDSDVIHVSIRHLILKGVF